METTPPSCLPKEATSAPLELSQMRIARPRSAPGDSQVDVMNCLPSLVNRNPEAGASMGLHSLRVPKRATAPLGSGSPRESFFTGVTGLLALGGGGAAAAAGAGRWRYTREINAGRINC